MKLARFESNGLPAIGVVSGDGIIKISDLLPEYTEMRQLAAAGPETLAKLEELVTTAKPSIRRDELPRARTRGSPAWDQAPGAPVLV
jgi:hypothetical protein